jgi:hypothetical protein
VQVDQPAEPLGAGGKRPETAVHVMNADGTGQRRLTDPALEAGEAD